MSPNLDDANADFSPTAAPAPSAAESPLAPKSSAALERFERQMGGLQERETKDFDQYNKDVAPRRAALNRTLDQPMPAPPQQEKIEPPPNPEDSKKNIMAFAAAMAVLGAVSSRFVRNVGTASLDAFAGSIKGWQEGNLQAYEQKAQEWKQATDKTIANNKMVQEKYKQVLENHKLNIDNQMAAIQTIAAEYHDKMTFDAAAAKNYTLVAQIYEKNAQFTAKAEAASDKIWEQHEKEFNKNVNKAGYLQSPAGQQALEEHIQSLPPEQQTAERLKYKGFAEVYGAKPMTQETARRIAEQVIAGDTTARQNIGRGVQSATDLRLINEQITQVANERGLTGADLARAQAEFQGQKAAERTLGTYGAKLSQASNAVDFFADQALDASKKLPRGSFVPANRAIQAYQSNTSDPSLYDLGFALMSLVNAYARAINPQGVPRIQDKEHATQFLSTATSPEALERVIARLKLETEAERQATEKTKQEMRGGPGASAAPKEGAAPKDKAGWSAVPVDSM